MPSISKLSLLSVVSILLSKLTIDALIKYMLARDFKQETSVFLQCVCPSSGPLGCFCTTGGVFCMGTVVSEAVAHFWWPCFQSSKCVLFFTLLLKLALLCILVSTELAILMCGRDIQTMLMGSGEGWMIEAGQSSIRWASHLMQCKLFFFHVFLMWLVYQWPIFLLLVNMLIYWCWNQSLEQILSDTD